MVGRNMNPLKEVDDVDDDWLEEQDNRPTAFPDGLPESSHVQLVVATHVSGKVRVFLVENEEQLELALNPYSFDEAQRLFFVVRRSSLEGLVKTV